MLLLLVLVLVLVLLLAMDITAIFMSTNKLY
jgi:hypothetical protein